MSQATDTAGGFGLRDNMGLTKDLIKIVLMILFKMYFPLDPGRNRSSVSFACRKKQCYKASGTSDETRKIKVLFHRRCAR